MSGNDKAVARPTELLKTYTALKNRFWIEAVQQTHGAITNGHCALRAATSKIKIFAV
jgi:hypothetical protein